MKIIKLPVFGIVVEFSQKTGSGRISSDLHSEGESKALKASLDAVEALILAHACAGVDIESPAYLEGIETVFTAIESLEA